MGIIRAVFFDYGGVLAEEGFREGLRAIGAKAGLDPDETFRVGRKVAFGGGYTTGLVGEAEFWRGFREATGITAGDLELRDEILVRFVLRPEMVEHVKECRSQGYITCMLSDQTNWLDELDRRDGFLRHFDRVFNSYLIGKSKADPSVFRDVAEAVGVSTEEALFIDDSEGNIKRAQGEGMNTILFTGLEEFGPRFRKFIEERAP